MVEFSLFDPGWPADCFALASPLRLTEGPPCTRKAGVLPDDHNLILQNLPDTTRAALDPHLELVPLTKGMSIYEAGGSIGYAYFPTAGLASWLALTTEGEMLELAAVGQDGVLGLPVVLQRDSSPHALVVQVPGAAFRIRADRLRAAVQRDATLRLALLRYADRAMAEIGQSAVCHHFHTILQRLCRWLLRAADRLRTDTFELTHEDLSLVLGVPRTGISRAVVELEDAGAVRARYGSLIILNRRRLELSACECYRAAMHE
jgi:CRP-like cAMP-binding protein